MASALDHSFKVFTMQLMHGQPPLQDGGLWTCRLRGGGAIKCTQAWIQGVVTLVNHNFLTINDGTDEILVDIEWLTQRDCLISPVYIGFYVMVVGVIRSMTEQGRLKPYLRVTKLVDLSNSPDRETLWFLEVVEDQCRRSRKR